MFLDKYFNRFFWITCLTIFIFIVLRAFFIPFSHDEAATFFFYIQSGNYLPYKAHVYTNNHILNSALAHVFFNFFGSHRFILRLPNVLSFLLLCIGVYRHFKHLNNLPSKLILITFLILTLNFLDFFELCRGYGLSIALLVIGLSYLLDYFTLKNSRSFFLFSIFFQLALSANLILVVLFALLLVFVIIFQIRYKLFFNLYNLCLQFINLSLLFFWIKFSFFYYSKGVLDSGAGNNYWKISFQSLIIWIFGTNQIWVQLIVVCCVLTLLFFMLIKLNKISSEFFSAKFFYPFIFFSLILIFYLQKIILHINFPEDRTGLFFYVFFILSFSLLIDSFNMYVARTISLFLFLLTLSYFIININISNFSSFFYQTMPKSFYDILMTEYKKTKQIFTIGGHRVRELNYAFLNYRGGSILNHMDDSENMHMNCDYYFALKNEKPYYDFFYDEIAQDEKWGRVLLKRKDKINRTLIHQVNQLPIVFKGNQEYFEFLRLSDSTLCSKNCLEADIEIEFSKVPSPLNGFLVFSVENDFKECVYYKRVPLNWLAFNLNSNTKYFKLTTGKIPSNFSSLVVYLWNIDKKDLIFKLKILQLNELNAKGINFEIPASFYPLIEKITKKPLL